MRNIRITLLNGEEVNVASSPDLVIDNNGISLADKLYVKGLLPEHLYVPIKREQTFYFNMFVFGNESRHGNYLDGIRFAVSADGSVKNAILCSDEGFTIFSHTECTGNITVTAYDKNNYTINTWHTNLIIYTPEKTNISCLMLGASWTDINNGNEGLTPFTRDALMEMGITPTFIGTRNAGTSGLKHQGVGGTTWRYYASESSSVRYKITVNPTPSVTVTKNKNNLGDVYVCNNVKFTIYEVGDGYLTVERYSISGGCPDNGTMVLDNTIGTASGTASFTFTNAYLNKGNPLWNSLTGKLDFTNYRQNICGLNTKLNFCNIELGGNECIAGTEEEIMQVPTYMEAIINCILADSPNCKIVVYPVHIDSPSTTGWTSIGFLSQNKLSYHKRAKLLCDVMVNYIQSRNDYNVNVFISQGYFGINRMNGYGHYDGRYRFFKVDTDSMTEENINKMRNRATGVFLYTQGNEYNFKFYDERGYLVAVKQPKLWIDQQFVTDESIEEITAGVLVKGGGSTTADFPDVPFKSMFVENNEAKKMYFNNGTHPCCSGYRQIAYTLANQIAYLVK